LIRQRGPREKSLRHPPAESNIEHHSNGEEEMPPLKTTVFLISAFLMAAIPAQAGDETIAVKGATILTVTKGTIENGVILISNGKITAVGADVPIPEGAKVIDASGQFVMPGIIDAHTHIALDWGDVNEATSPSTPQVRMAEVLIPDSYSIYRAVAGGVTAAKIMHGSANVIGGLNATVKLKYRHSVEEMLIPGVRQQLKMALGENPTRLYGGKGRMPSTRMGVFAILRQKLLDAQAYKAGWDKYNKDVSEGKQPTPPKRDLEMDMLVDLLAGKISIDCHCYVASEIVTLLKVADEFKLPLKCLSHAFEAYKVRDEIAKRGVSVLTHTDWWGYKMEAFDAIPYAPAMLMHSGINTCIVSDSADVIRRLNREAAKLVRYSGVTDDEALAMITINPARALEIDGRCGSIEVGKDADLAIFNKHPLDSLSKCVMTLIEGEVIFDINEPKTALER
jgi:imidazolonepropionase-like amidohydrolase